VKVQATYPQPTLTPFDFIIVKCRALVAEIVTVVSKYDEAIIDGMNVRDEILENVRIDWLEGWYAHAPAPLDGAQIKFCLDHIFLVIDALSTHPVQGNDLAKQSPTFNFGFYRRLELLRQLNTKRIWGAVMKALRSIATGDSRTVAEIDNLTTLANSIDDDLRRAFKDCSALSLEYDYMGGLRQS
jgi:hypothetical protein